MLDNLQDAVLEGQNKQNKDSENPKYKFDKLQMYFGEDYEVAGIKISQPTIGQILKIGENRFYQSLSPFLYNSTSIRLFLWEGLNKDWNKVRDIEVFAILSQMAEKDVLALLFHDVDFTDFRLLTVRDKDNDDVENFILYSESQNIIISEDDYMTIAEYIREMLNIHPKVERAKGKSTKKWMLQEDKMNFAAKKDDNNNSSTLLPLVSSCTNYSGFKYNLQELKDVGICQFMDSVKRIQKYESSTAALKGIYSGFVDVKKMDKEVFNFMGEI